MNWGSWHDFLAMGGYALYVWGSYVVTAGLIALEVILLMFRRRNALQGLRGPARGGRP
jgi:heme exporter protein D